MQRMFVEIALPVSWLSLFGLLRCLLLLFLEADGLLVRRVGFRDAAQRIEDG